MLFSLMLYNLIRFRPVRSEGVVLTILVGLLELLTGIVIFANWMNG